MSRFLFVAAGGAVGAVARYAISVAMQRGATASRMPYATLTANVAGCFLIGLLLTGFEDPRFTVAPALRLAIVTGLLGSLTTFSTFSYETLELFDAGQPAQAAVNVGLNLALGLGAAVLGRVLARAVLAA